MNLEIRRKKIAAYAYSFLRMLEFESAWVAIVSNLEFKILLGYKIGFDSIHLKSLCNRLGEMLIKNIPVSPSQEYSGNFDRYAHLENKEEIASFLVDLMLDLKASIDLYLHEGDQIADQPSILILDSINKTIEEQIKIFQKYKKQTFNIFNIDFQSSLNKEYTGQEILPRLIDFPARPKEFVYNTENILSEFSLEEVINTEHGKVRLLYFVYIDIEIPAIEVCSRNIVEFRNMPLDFKLDMARQCWDEARHAVLIRDRLKELGGKEGDYTYDCNVWSRYLLGETLAERLAIQHIVQEGNGLDSGIFFANQLRKVHDIKTANIFDFLNADESNHARFGNKWLLYLVQNSSLEYQKCLNKAARKINKEVPSQFPVDFSARIHAGFPLWLIESWQ